MKILSLISFLFFCGSVWSSEYCKGHAQKAVDVRDDYKNLAEVEAAIATQRAYLPMFTGQALINVQYDIEKLRIYGQIVFLHSSGAKGSKLFKLTYDRCVAEEKTISDRNAKQTAREAERSAQDKQNQEQIQRINESQIKRIQGIAQGMASPPQRISLPSASYAGKIKELIQSNINFPDPSARNSWVIILVKISSNGLILSRRVVGSSGNNSWNEEVMRAVDKMASVPSDTNGLIPEALLQEGMEIKVTF
jgi:TonB family protein